MLRTYKYRMYPTPRQISVLENVLYRCRELYNGALQERREAYCKAGKSVSYKEQQQQLPACKKGYPELNEVYAQVLQDTLRRLDKAFKAFFRRI